MPKINLDSSKCAHASKHRAITFNKIIQEKQISLPVSRAEICSCGPEAVQLLNQLILDGLIGGYKYSHYWTPLGEEALHD
jgi:hypothetical protein